MARSIWTGSLAFGLVNVPVAVFSATEDHTIHFNQFQAGTSDRIRYQRVNERTGEEVDYSDIVRGHEIGDGDYVLITDEELEAVEPGQSRTIEITDFVELAGIDPIYYQRTYYLAPRGPDGERAYALLRQAMTVTGRAAIATIVMRGKQHLVTVRPEGNVLALETMYFADEVRDPGEELGSLPSSRGVRDRELDIARQLVESMSTDWRPEKYRDTYRERVEDLIDRKRKGQEVVTENEQPAEAGVVDLMDALRRSAEAAREGGGRAGGSRAGGSRKKGGRAASTGGGAGVDQMSKSELARAAAGLDISGRSMMSREELASAVRKARRARSRQAS